MRRFFLRPAGDRYYRWGLYTTALLVLGLAGATPGLAQAQAKAQAKTQAKAKAKAKSKQSKVYYFLASGVEAGEGLPAELADTVRAELAKAIAAHEQLVGALPDQAPDPSQDPQGFRTFIKKHGIEPFRVNVEVTAYHHQAVSQPAPRKGQRLEVHIALHLFGETMPKRVIAFSGDGSATVQLEVGKRLRPRDSRIANQEATTLAVADALAASIKRLESKNKRGRKGKRARKKK